MLIVNQKRLKQLSNKNVVKKNIFSVIDVPLKKVLYLSFTLSILNLVTVLAIQNNLPPEVPLYYGLPEGPEQLSSSLGLTIPSIVSIIVIFLNTTLALLLKNKFLQQTLILTSFAISIFSSITVTKIILLVGNF